MEYIMSKQMSWEDRLDFECGSLTGIQYTIIVNFISQLLKDQREMCAKKFKIGCWLEDKTNNLVDPFEIQTYNDILNAPEPQTEGKVKCLQP
jgi:hypothetical protein